MTVQNLAGAHDIIGPSAGAQLRRRVFGHAGFMLGIAIILGIDKFMSECRALTNLIGNGVATVVISRWEGELDARALHETMAHPFAVGAEL